MTSPVVGPLSASSRFLPVAEVIAWAGAFRATLCAVVYFVCRRTYAVDVSENEDNILFKRAVNSFCGNITE